MSIYKNKKDVSYRKELKKNENKCNMLKMLRRNEMLPKEMRNYYSDQLTAIAKKGSICKIKNRCILTGRARGVISEYKVSRMQFRELVKLGLVTGIRKSSY
uniref:Ribosomal protein S14 n=1 Tax=Cavenderia fasciculata TaxID=261658 RepID=B2XXA0_CACFS|nr:ribosomal protein S14 [Cavenderia fasciculata]ABX45222.1 ribosomal protein S14 [Cavenderia fasciculata]